MLEITENKLFWERKRAIFERNKQKKMVLSKLNEHLLKKMLK